MRLAQKAWEKACDNRRLDSLEDQLSTIERQLERVSRTDLSPPGRKKLERLLDTVVVQELRQQKKEIEQAPWLLPHPQLSFSDVGRLCLEVEKLLAAVPGWVFEEAEPE